jgi:hypothetical protein
VRPAPPTAEEFADHRARVAHEIPIKIGSALYSRLRKRYWELPVVQGRPFVIAVEAFHPEQTPMRLETMNLYVEPSSS